MRSQDIRPLSIVLLLAATLTALPVLAGGPLDPNPNDPENFSRWPNGGLNIPFNPDGIPAGGTGALALGPITYADAVALVESAFQVWEDVPTATATYSNDGPLSEDIDVTNFAPLVQNIFFGGTTSDGVSPIVFDDDGSIFVSLFGFSGVLGFASPDTFDANGVPIEGVSFLNGGQIGPGFPEADFFAVMVHEFGHYSGMAHTVTNGQNIVLGDTTGPSPNNTYGDAPGNQVETMYPFAEVGGGQETLHIDETGFFSTLYPAGSVDSVFGILTGTIFAPDGTTPLTGINVIARNVANPFIEASSAISGDRGVTGVYSIRVPPGDYTIHVDEILDGGFSTTPADLPGPEEFYNGASESNNVTSPDDPTDSVTVTVTAGATASGLDIIFNTPGPGDPLDVGDDGSVELFMPFTYCVCGQPFNSLFANANGSVTFGQPSSDFSESTVEFLAGPPRVAGVWDDLNPSSGGTVTFDQTSSSFTVSWTDVPEFISTGSNTFAITLRDNSNKCVAGDDDDDDDDDGGNAHPGLSMSGDVMSDDDDDDDDDGGSSEELTITYGDVSATDGLSGVSCGGAVTSGFETESDLTSLGNKRIKLDKVAAVFELFSAADNDLDNTSNRYRVGKGFKDKFENNDTLSKAKKVKLPFDTIDTKKRFSEIRPAGDDVDYFELRKLKAGETLIAEVLTGQIDTVLGLFQLVGSHDDDDDDDDGGDGAIHLQGADEAFDDDDDDDDGGGVTGTLVASDDDGGSGVLSRIVFEIPADGDYALAVSTFDDLDFTGDGNPLSGEGRYVLEVFTVQGTVLTLGDDASVEVPFGFSFPFAGSTHSSVFVNSNGNLTFVTGDTDFSESISEFEAEAPRIAPLWDDLSPNNGGLVLANDEGSSLTISFIGVPEFISTGSNTFQVTLFASGDVEIAYGDVSATDGLVGVTGGGGAVSTATDFSATGGGTIGDSPVELFNFGNPYDLPVGQILGFTP